MLNDEGLVKLGSKAELQWHGGRIEVAQGAQASRGLRVVEGAFRYSPREHARHKPHTLRIDVAGITVAVRATDVWVRASEVEDVVCLLGGALRIERKREGAVDMTKPHTVYRAPRGGEAMPVAAVSAAQVRRWVNSVEVLAANGVLGTSGGFGVVVQSNKRGRASLAARDQFERIGIASDVEQATVRGARWYRVVVRGFDDAGSARDFARSIDGNHGVSAPWVIGPKQ